MPYTKPAITISDQLERLTRRGLHVEDTRRATHHLRYVSYFRLRGYFAQLSKDPQDWRSGFREGATFEDLLDLYNVDREIRLFATHMLERLEVGLRALLIQHFCDGLGPVWYDDLKNFYRHDWWEQTRWKLIDELDRSQEEFMVRHKRKYGLNQGLPPAWKAFEVASIGTLSYLYKNIDNTHKKRMSRVASALNASRTTTLNNWLHAFTILRNMCAHHSRLYGRHLPVPIALPQITGAAVKRYGWLNTSPQPSTPYAVLAVLAFTMQKVSPGNRFAQRLHAIIEAYPNLDYTHLGFTTGWAEEPLWCEK